MGGGGGGDSLYTVQLIIIILVFRAHSLGLFTVGAVAPMACKFLSVCCVFVFFDEE